MAVYSADSWFFMALFGAADDAARLHKYSSYVDCMSMIVMEDFGIQQLLTNDDHLKQAGFTLVNE